MSTFNFHRTLACGVLVGLLACLAGCSAGRNAAMVANAGKLLAMSQEPGPTISKTVGEHLHQIETVIDYDRRAIFNDLDLFFQTERPSRLSRFVDR